MKLAEFEGKLADLDDEAVEDCVFAAIHSFGHQFTKEDLSQLVTLGDFYTLIEKKFADRHSPVHTGQQVYYKLRQTIADILQIDKNGITPSTSLSELFPRKQRWRKLKQLRAAMGIKTRMVEMVGWLRILFTLAMLSSLVLLFFDLVPGLIILVALIGLNRFAAVFNNKLSYPNVGELAEYLHIFEFAAMRRSPDTVNPYEVRAVVKQVFIKREELKQEEYTPEEN